LGTFPFAINAEGVIVGAYNDRSGKIHGFVRTVDGAVTPYDAPHAFQTWLLGITDKGEMAGYWIGNTDHGFVRSPTGKITSFDVPDALRTRATAINSRGAAIGWYMDKTYAVHGYIRQRDGDFTTFDAPGVPARPPTYPVAINTRERSQDGATPIM